MSIKPHVTDAAIQLIAVARPVTTPIVAKA